MCKYRSKKYNLINSIIIIVIVILSLLSSSLLALNPFYRFYKEAAAQSPSFELQEITNENRHWVQTYGSSDANLKSNYTDIQAVNYISDGKAWILRFG